MPTGKTKFAKTCRVKIMPDRKDCLALVSFDVSSFLSSRFKINLRNPDNSSRMFHFHDTMVQILDGLACSVLMTDFAAEISRKLVWWFVLA